MHIDRVISYYSANVFRQDVITDEVSFTSVQALSFVIVDKYLVSLVFS